MQGSLTLLSTFNRLTGALIDEGRILTSPLTAILESLSKIASLDGLRNATVFRFNEEALRKPVSSLALHKCTPKSSLTRLSPAVSSFLPFLEGTQRFLSTRLSAEEYDWQLPGNRKKSNGNGGTVFNLTEENFDDFIKGSPVVCVLYHATWCGICQQMKPVWRNAAETMASNKNGVYMAAVDVTAQSDLALRENVTTIPAVKLYGGGKFIRDISTPIALKDLLRILDNPSGAETSTNKEPAINKGSGVSTEALKQLQAVAEALENKSTEMVCALDCEANAEVCQQLAVSDDPLPQLRYFHYLMKRQSYYSGNFTSTSMLEFLRTSASAAGQDGSDKRDVSKDWASIPDNEHVILLNDATFERAVKAQPLLLVMFYGAWCRHCATLKPTVAAAAAELSNQGYPKTLAACEIVANSRVGQLFDIEFVPSFRLFENGKAVSDYSRLRTKEEIVRTVIERSKSK